MNDWCDFRLSVYIATTAGLPVVIDGTFLRQTRREAVERAAKEASLTFCGIWVGAHPKCMDVTGLPTTGTTVRVNTP